MLMWVSNRSFNIVHIWFCFLFLFRPRLFVPSSIFIHTVEHFTFVCTPSQFQRRMRRLLVRRRSGQRRLQRALPTPQWRRRPSPRPRVRTQGRPSRGLTLSLTSTSQMCLAESSPPRQLMVTFKQNTSPNQTHRPLKCMTSKCCTPLRYTDSFF